MLGISLQTLRARRGTLAGAFVAIWLAVTLACAAGLLMAGTLAPPGAGRFAAIDAIVRADSTVTIGQGDDAEDLNVVPGPRLTAGRAPGGARDVVADARTRTRIGSVLRIVSPAGDARFRVTGLADARGLGDPSQTAVFFRPDVAAALSGATAQVNAIGVIAERGTSVAALHARLRARFGNGFDVLDRRHAANADAGDPT